MHYPKMMGFMSFVFLMLTSAGFSQEVVWKGDVSADGNPSPAIDIELDKKYQIVVKGTVNLGKWVEAGKILGEDAAFEFNGPTGPERNVIFRNSNNIPLNDKNFNTEHIYKTEPFVAKQNKIHFWVQDRDYGDNNGSFQVEIIKL